MIPIALVGNCQASALCAVLHKSDVLQCGLVLDVNGRGSDYLANAVFKLYAKSGTDFVFSQAMGDDFDDLSSRRLRAHYQSKFSNFTNLYFSGLQPDLTYFGGFGHRIEGPLGDYHSRIALAAFIQGYSTDACLAAFNGATYERLGYFLQFPHSLAELERRDEGNQFKFAARFAELTRSTLTMLSVNHPTLATLVELAQMFESHFTDRRSALAPDICFSPLNSGPVWPLYPEIREHHALPYETAFHFYPGEGKGPVMTLDEFVLASYASYERQGRDLIVASDASKAFASIPLV